MADQVMYNHIEMNRKTLKNTGPERLSADPSGGDLWEGRRWYNTTDHVERFYNGTSVVTVTTGSVATSLKFMGAISGNTSYNGLTGSGVSAAIVAGDAWLATATLTFTYGDSSTVTLHAGDQLVALVANADDPADFWINHGEVLDLSPYAKVETQSSIDLVEDTEYTVTAATLTVVKDVQVLGPVSSGKRSDITDSVELTYDDSDTTKVYITSGVGLTDCKVILEGA